MKAWKRKDVRVKVNSMTKLNKFHMKEKTNIKGIKKRIKNDKRK